MSETEQLEPMSDSMSAVYSMMLMKGLHRIEINYSGGGDSGELSDLIFYDNDDQQLGDDMSVEISNLFVVFKTGVNDGVPYYSRLSISRACEYIWDELLSASGHSGFGNNEGGDGTMTLYRDGNVTMEHRDFENEQECVLNIGINSNYELIELTNPDDGASVSNDDFSLPQRATEIINQVVRGFIADGCQEVNFTYNFYGEDSGDSNISFKSASGEWVYGTDVAAVLNKHLTNEEEDELLDIMDDASADLYVEDSEHMELDIYARHSSEEGNPELIEMRIEAVCTVEGSSGSSYDWKFDVTPVIDNLTAVGLIADATAQRRMAP